MPKHAGKLVDIAKFSKAHDHFKRMNERAAVKKAVAVFRG